MPKVQTLKNNYDFRRLYKRGKTYHSPALVTYCLKNRVGACRIGITASKKIGNAVQRNRARRIIKAAFISLLPEIDASVDLVFVARTKTVKLKAPEIETLMRKHLSQAGVLR